VGGMRLRAAVRREVRRGWRVWQAPQPPRARPVARLKVGPSHLRRDGDRATHFYPIRECLTDDLRPAWDRLLTPMNADGGRDTFRGQGWFYLWIEEWVYWAAQALVQPGRDHQPQRHDVGLLTLRYKRTPGMPRPQGGPR
jgi:hypothetical protein